jgi:hypothetical protein
LLPLALGVALVLPLMLGEDVLRLLGGVLNP